MRRGDKSGRWLRESALGAALAIWLWFAPVVRGENRVDLKYQSWLEDGNRVEVESSYLYFENDVSPSMSLKVQVAYDAVSGATPTGAPPPDGETLVPLAEFQDDRAGAYIELRKTWGFYSLAGQIAGSYERDYQSMAFSLKNIFEFNKKNTTLTLGGATTFDRVDAVTMEGARGKDNYDFLFGLTQVLTPTTVLTANVTYGYGTGYFTDPYRIALVDGLFLFENRPDYKDRFIVYTALTQYVKPMHASVMVDYRYFADSFGISSQTASFEWNQQLWGDRLVVSPFFRYSRQGQAEFYDAQFNNAPRYYSSDWRLSEMETMSYGGKVSLILAEALTIDVAFERYDMRGLDERTSQSAYAPANVFTVGGTVRY